MHPRSSASKPTQQSKSFKSTNQSPASLTLMKKSYKSKKGSRSITDPKIVHHSFQSLQLAGPRVDTRRPEILLHTLQR